ncbi:MAG: hypothetical protein IKS43_04225, partial [Clostridia bacterium]|nr:hypothetical protein [Clostridia bacterium]MBR6428848.1 hypothetical protein [Clostridia bacterium]
LRIHSLKRYLFAPLFVENARKTKTGIPALFALMGTKISSFETLRGFRPSKRKQIRGSFPPDLLLFQVVLPAENLPLLK